MGSTSVSSSTALVAGSLLVAAASVGLYNWSNSSSSSSNAIVSRTAGEITDIDEDDDDNINKEGEDEYITPQEVKQIFDKLHVEMQAVFAQLMQQVQQIQMSGAAGANFSERQLKGLVAAEMERALQMKQKLILDEFDIDYDCLEEATWEFLEKEEEENDEHAAMIKKSVERFQKFWQTTTGAPVAGWRPGKTAEQMAAAIAQAEQVDVLSAERTIEVAEIYFSSMTDTMRKLVAEFKAAGKNLQQPAVAQQLNATFAAQASEEAEVALDQKAGGVTQAQFEASIKAHSENPTVGRALGMMQMQQQQEMMALSSM